MLSDAFRCFQNVPGTLSGIFRSFHGRWRSFEIFDDLFGDEGPDDRSEDYYSASVRRVGRYAVDLRHRRSLPLDVHR